MRTPTETFTSELSMCEERYRLLIDQAIDKTNHYRGAPYVSTHLGHNLASLAGELSEAAARYEEAQRALLWAGEFEGIVNQLVAFVVMVRDETMPTGDGFPPSNSDSDQLLILQNKADKLIERIFPGSTSTRKDIE